MGRAYRRLSGGEKRRVALCRLLLSKPDMLLLDEPTNHLDAESVEWLEQYLQRFPGTVVGITHDRYFLDNAARGSWNSTVAMASPGRATTAPGSRRRRSAWQWRSDQKAARSKSIKQELDWVRQNPKGRQAKSKARHGAL